MRISLVEDHALFAQALALVLLSHGYDVTRVDLPAEPTTTTGLCRTVLASRPEVVLLDLDLGPHGSGTSLVAPLTTAGSAVVVVTADRDPARWGECLAAGARTVLAKDRSLDDVLAVVRRLGEGRAPLAAGERERLLAAWRQRQAAHHHQDARLALLTRREAQVLAHLVDGEQVRDIARLSVVAESTVRSQVKAILAKLQVSSQVAAVGLAHHAGWHAPVVPAQPTRCSRRAASAMEPLIEG